MWALIFIVIIIILFRKIESLNRKVDLLEGEIKKLFRTDRINGAEDKKEIEPLPPGLSETAPGKRVEASPPGTACPVPTEPEKESKSGSPAPYTEEGGTNLKEWLRLERIVGERWLVWVGAFIFASGLAFFIKHAFEQGWINASARVLLGFAAGFIFMGLGEFLYGKKYNALAQGISSLGLIIFYLTTYTAFHFYNMLGSGPAFFLFFITSVGGIAVAMHHDALPAAFLSVLGAFATPLLLVDPASAIYYEPRLFSYLFIVNLGVLYAASARKWRALSFCSFLFTVFYFGSWYLSRYTPSDFNLAAIFAVVYFLTFSLISTTYSMLRKGKSNWEDVVLVILNPAIFFLLIYNMAAGRGIAEILPYIPVFMAAYHFILASAIRKVNPGDIFLYFALSGTAVGLLTLPVPMIVKASWITAAWGIQALILIIAGSFLDRKTLRTGGFAVLALAAWRLFALDASIPYHRGGASPLFFNPGFLALLISSCTLGIAGILFNKLKNISPAEKKYPAALFPLFAAALFWIANVEIFSYFSSLKTSFSAMKWVFTTILWTLFSSFFLAAGISRGNFALRKAGFLLLLAASLKWLLLDTVFLYDNPYGYPFILNLKFLSLLLILGVAAGSAVFYGRGVKEENEREKGIIPACWLFFISLLFIGLNIEVVAFLGSSDLFSAGSAGFIFTTILWSFFAFFLFLFGFKERISFLRRAGIILVTGAFIKVLAELYFVYPYPCGYPFLFNLRFLSAGTVLFSLAYAASLYGCGSIEKAGIEKKAASYLSILFILLFFIELNVQVVSSSSRVWNLGEQKTAAALSFLWAFYGFCLLLAGIIKKIMPLRIAALSLFGVTLAKVLSVDMRFVDRLYKMMLLLGIGAVLLAGAFFYRKYRRNLGDKT